jgi:RNA polymerase sigma-70 factor (ECF subfamily)
MDGGPLPEEILALKGTRLRVVEALAVLPDDYRRALVARYADQRSVGDVAKLLGRNYKATESLLGRARTAFRAAFLAESEEEHDGR